MDSIKEKIIKDIYNENFYSIVISKAIEIFIYIIAAYFLLKIFLIITDYFMKNRIKINNKLGVKTNEKRNETVRKLIKSVIKYLVYFVLIIQIMSICGINTSGIIASAGLVSVAIGFGAQSLVKDVITGFFIILEGQFDVGDYVRIHNQVAFIAEGNVSSLGLRSTKIVAKTGEVYYIPNSSINQVINYSRNYNLAKVELKILINEETIEILENNIIKLLNKLNNLEIYNKNYYNKEKFVINSIKNIENNVVSLEIVARAKIGKNSILESMLIKDFYNVFKERIV